MENLPLQDNQFIGTNNFPKKSFLPKKMFFSVIVLFLSIIFGYYLFFSAPDNFPKGIIVNIEKGESLRSLSLNLKEKNVIRSRTSFEAFVIMYGGEKHIAVGDYLFENKLPVFEIARRIVEKDRRLASVKITVPEGFDVSEISDSVSSKLRNFNKEKFLRDAKEGYLFPDTYFFFSYDNEQDVLNYMTDNFEKKIKTLKQEVISSGKSENEIITMASIIEREAKGDSDRAYISGILWNRIKKNMPLQVDSAMETYKTRGLPASPICNPGLEAIKASIHPMISNYLY